MNDYFNGVYFDYETDRLLCLHDLKRLVGVVDTDTLYALYLSVYLYKVERG